MSFDRLAPHYAWMEWLLAGRKLQTSRTVFVKEARQARSVLLVGEGHGRFLTELCRANPEAAICCVDASAEMNRVARQRLQRAGLSLRNLEFHSVPILEFKSTRRFDLVVTQFFLDCFDESELVEVIGKLASALSEGGTWIVADFQIPEKGWRRQRARLVLTMAYAFFRIATKLPARRLSPPQKHFSASGLQLKERAEFNFGLIYSELWCASCARTFSG